MADYKRARLPTGVELCWDERGQGPAIVLIMGIGAQLIYWPEGFCDRLADAGFRVIRFDNRDVGQSSRLDHLPVPPPGRTLMSALLGAPVEAPYALEDMARDVAHLLDALAIEDAHVVGVSMGGMIAQTMAFLFPERVRSLTSIMSTTGAKALIMSEPRALRALLGPAPRTREASIARALDFFRTVGSTGFDRDEVAAAERAGLAWDRAGGVYPRGFLRQFAAIGATGDRTARLRFVRAPTLVIHGSVDPLIRPLGGRLTAAAIPGARLEMVEGMGHDLPSGAWSRLTGSIIAHARAA